jgi:microcystin-dependent protein
MDISQSVWAEADASNSTPAPDGAPEGMAPSGVNDTIRADRGAIKRWYNQTIPLLTAGTSTAYTLAYSVAPTALADGQTHLVQLNAANGVAATLNVNALGAKPLHYYAAGDWRVIPSGLLGANQIARVAYNAAAGTYRLIDLDNKTGEVVSFGGTAPPKGALLCFGQAVSRADFVGLFTAISTTFGVGDGSTTFNVPDLRGMVAGGKTDMGGSDRGNLSGGTVLGAALGTQSVSSGGPGSEVPVSNTSTNVNVGADGHTHSVTVVQPTIVLNYIIKT